MRSFHSEALLDEQVIRDLLGLPSKSHGNLFLEMRDLYATKAAESLQEIDQASKLGDRSKLKFELHTMAGMSANIGCTGVAQRCLKIEEDLRKGGSMQVQDQVAKLFEVVAGTKAAMEQVR